MSSLSMNFHTRQLNKLDGWSNTKRNGWSDTERYGWLDRERDVWSDTDSDGWSDNGVNDNDFGGCDHDWKNNNSSRPNDPNDCSPSRVTDRPNIHTPSNSFDNNQRRSTSFISWIHEECEAFDRRNREGQIIIGPCADGVQMASEDLDLCPPWRVNGAQSEHRSVPDFLDQFWFKIGTYISDTAQCLLRFSMILDASEATQFMVEPIHEYIARKRQMNEPCEFFFAENLLRRTYWSVYHQTEIANKFCSTVYDQNICSMIQFATFWHRRLKQIGRIAPNYTLRAVYDKLPDEFKLWCKSQGLKKPDTLQECCQWAAWYEAIHHPEEALGGSIKIPTATAVLDAEN